ncbi:MAG: class I SAM-dependent methyltransferase [Gemmataceae bacterium]
MLTEKHKLMDEVEALPTWWHSIDLGYGIVTPGRKSRTYLQQELAALRLPDLHGQTVLDVGAWDGFYSFEAERRGASRVVALDHFVWSIHWASLHRYKSEVSGRPLAPGAFRRLPGVWQPDALPGQAGFRLAHRVLGSRVEVVVADLMTADLNALGAFDVVLYLGVLYHVENPLAALRRVAAVTRRVAVIETNATVFPGLEHRSVCEFYEADELSNDATNWWGPNWRALVGLCRAAGFRHVETIQGPPDVKGLPAGEVAHYRAIVHAWK